MSLKNQAQTALSGVSNFLQGMLRFVCRRGKPDAPQRTGDAGRSGLGVFACDANQFGVGDRADRATEKSRRFTFQAAHLFAGADQPDRSRCRSMRRATASNPPQRDDNGTQYYELLVRKGGELSLRRYQKQPGGVRHATAAHVTRQVFLRLVSDFSDAAI